MRLKRIGVAAVLAWAVTAGAQPTVPGEHALHHLAPAANASQAGVTLAEAVDAAWRRSTQSAEAAGAERRARAQRTVASSLLPAPPALEVGYSRLRERGAGGHETEVAVAMPLWLPGQRSASQAVATAQSDAASATAAAGRHEVAGRVLDGLWAVELQRAEVAAAQAQSDELKTLSADVDRRVAAGDLPRADALATRAQRLEAVARLRQAQQGLNAAMLRWTALTGFANLPAVGVDTQLSDAEVVSDEHPALRLARLNVDLTRQQVEFIQASRREAPELVAGLRREAPGASEPATNSVGLAIRIPFSGPQRNEPLLAAALAELEVGQATLSQTQLLLQADVAIARTEFDAVLLQMDDAIARERMLRERAGLMRKSYQAGETALPELLRALAAATEAHASSLRQKATLGLARARLQQALGVTP
ncbi:MAG: TolC family protein [Burkholderiaceae bacterium]|nr:TolC family protein [Burkholderiaceae bacterium]